MGDTMKPTKFLPASLSQPTGDCAWAKSPTTADSKRRECEYSVESLHFAQPGRHGSRIKAHASADPETGDATSFRQLEDRDAGYREQFREFNSCESVTELLDAIGQRRRGVGHEMNSGMKISRRTPLLAVPQWPGGHVGCFSMAVLAGSPIPMAPFWFGLLTSAARCAEPSPRSLPSERPSVSK